MNLAAPSRPIVEKREMVHIRSTRTATDNRPTSPLNCLICLGPPLRPIASPPLQQQTRQHKTSNSNHNQSTTTTTNLPGIKKQFTSSSRPADLKSYKAWKTSKSLALKMERSSRSDRVRFTNGELGMLELVWWRKRRSGAALAVIWRWRSEAAGGFGGEGRCWNWLKCPDLGNFLIWVMVTFLLYSGNWINTSIIPWWKDF